MTPYDIDAMLERTDWPPLDTTHQPWNRALQTLVEEVLHCRDLEAFTRYVRVVLDQLDAHLRAGVLVPVATPPGSMPEIPGEQDYHVTQGLQIFDMPVNTLRREHGFGLGVQLHLATPPEAAKDRLLQVVPGEFQASTLRQGLKVYGKTVPIPEMADSDPQSPPYYLLTLMETPDGGTHLMCFPWSDREMR